MQANRNNEIRNQEATQLSFWSAYATQFDFESPSVQEAWYGHQYPWRRILFCLVLFNIAHTLEFCVCLPFSTSPILRLLSEQELDAMKLSHSYCWEAVCNLVQEEVDFDCVISQPNPGGVASAEVDFDSYTGPYSVELPEACRHAILNTLGLQENVSSPEPSLITIKTESQLKLERLHQQYGAVKQTKEPYTWSIFSIYPDCTFRVPDQPSQDGRAPDPWVYHLQEKPFVRGQRLRSVLSNELCPDSSEKKLLNVATKEDAVTAYNWLLHHRHILAVAFDVCACAFSQAFMLLVAMVQLFFFTLVLRRLVRCPTNTVSHQNVGFWSTWSTLLLIHVYTGGYSYHGDFTKDNVDSYGMLLLHLLILGFANHHHQNNQACIEFLFITFCRSNHVEVSNVLLQFGGLGLLRWILCLVPGQNEANKFVTLYAFGRAYYPLLMRG